MAKIELTPEEATFIYQMLDQVSVKGLSQKKIIVSIMEKLEWVQLQTPAPESDKEEPAKPKKRAGK